MAKILQEKLKAMEEAAHAVAHHYCEELLQESVPGTPSLTDKPLEELLTDTCSLGSIPALLSHPSTKGKITRAAGVLGIYRNTLAKRIKALNIEIPAPEAA